MSQKSINYNWSQPETMNYSSSRKRAHPGKSIDAVSRVVAQKASRYAKTKGAYRPRRFMFGYQIKGGRQTVLPERLYTWVETTQLNYIPIGNMTAANGNYMNLCVNSFWQPFNTTYVANTAANLYSWHGSFVQGSSNIQEPMGYTSLSALYQMYKVLRWKVEVCCQPESSNDPVRIVLFPIGNQQIPSSAGGNINCNTFESQPHAVARTCANGSTSYYNTAMISMKTCDTLGKRQQQWNDIDGALVTGLPATNDQAFLGIFAQMINGTSNVAPVTFSIKLYQYIEFSDLTAQIS